MALKINDKFTREFHIDSVDGDSGNFITISLSSEFPAPRDFGDEVLLHGPDNIDMSRAGQPQGIPLLINHKKDALPSGRIKNLRVDADRKLRGDAYFSGAPEAQQYKADVQAGIITDTSLGYIVKAFKKVPGGGTDGRDRYDVTRWMPFEGSLVGLPEDPFVGVGRSMGGGVEDGVDDPTITNPVLSSVEVATGLGEGSTNQGAEIGEQTGPDPDPAIHSRELGLVDGMLDAGVSTQDNTTLENASDPGGATGSPAPATSDASDPTAQLQEPDDDTNLYYERSAHFTDDPLTEEEEEEEERTRSGKEPYGDVEYADPGYQADHQKRYPIDTKDHTEAANSYIHKKVNAAKYSPADLKKVVDRIDAAMKKFGIGTAETKEMECGTAEETRILGGDKPAPSTAELPDPLLTEAAPGTVSALSLPPVPPDPEDPIQDPPLEGDNLNRSLNPDQSELLNDSTSEVSALRSVALKFNTTRTLAEIDQILSTRSLAEARGILLTTPEPPSKTIRIEPGRPKMLTPQILTRAMDLAVRGNWEAIRTLDDGSALAVLAQKDQKRFSIDLFHDSVGGADYMSARKRFLSGGGMQMQRDMTTSADSSTVFQTPIGFIDYLFSRTALLKAGARIKTGVGSLAYIKVSTPAAVTAQGEDASAPSSTAPTFTKVPYAPHAIVSKVPVTVELQKEAALDLQPIIRSNVSKAFAVVMDQVGLNGVTTPYTQAGILQSGNSTQQNLGASSLPSFSDVNQLKATVDKVAVDLDTCSFITNPQLFAQLENTPRLSGGLLPMADKNQINGYRAFTTSNIANNYATGGTLSVTTGGVMTLVAAPTAGAVSLNMGITATGVPTGAYIGSLLSGTLNAPGSTYQLVLNGANAACTSESTETFIGGGNTLLFGDFSDFEFCFQGPLEVMVDDITEFSQGITNLVFRQYFDTGVLQPSAFCHCDNYQY